MSPSAGYSGFRDGSRDFRDGGIGRTPAPTAGTALLALGAVYGLWLLLTGAGVLVPGVLGLVFQYGARDIRGPRMISEESR